MYPLTSIGLPYDSATHTPSYIISPKYLEGLAKQYGIVTLGDILHASPDTTLTLHEDRRSKTKVIPGVNRILEYLAIGPETWLIKELFDRPLPVFDLPFARQDRLNAIKRALDTATEYDLINRGHDKRGATPRPGITPTQRLILHLRYGLEHGICLSHLASAQQAISAGLIQTKRTSPAQITQLTIDNLQSALDRLREHRPFQKCFYRLYEG